MKRFINAQVDLYTKQRAEIENAIANGKGTENALSEADLQVLESKKAAFDEAIAKFQAMEEMATADEVLAEVKRLFTNQDSELENRITASTENAMRMFKIAQEGDGSRKEHKTFSQAYENEIKMLSDLATGNIRGVRLENAITITPAGSAPIPDGLIMAQPMLMLPEIFNIAPESTGDLLTGARPGAKLRVMKMTSTGDPTGSTAEGATLGETALNMTFVDQSPLKVATTIQGVTMESLEYNGWLEEIVKMYSAKLLFVALEKQSAAVLDANSTAWDTTSGTAEKVTKAYIENIAVAGAIQLDAANVGGQKVAFVNMADWTNALNQQTDTAYPIENTKIREVIKFVPSNAIPAGNMYVGSLDYIAKKIYKDVWVERAIGHKHNTAGTAREYDDTYDFIFNALAFYYVTDAKAVIKLVNATVAAAIIKTVPAAG